MAKKRRFGSLVFTVLLLAAAGGGAWWYYRARGEEKPIYQIVTLERGSIIQSVTATGQLQPVITVEVGSQVSGRLKEVLVDFNDKVKKDQVLARIDPATFESAVAQADAELLNAKAGLHLQQSNLERSKQLFAQHLVSSADIEQLEAQVEQAEANVRIREFALESRQTDLKRCTIVAPIDGIVISRDVQAGQTVAASLNAPVLFTIANDLSKMQISASVSEADVGSIAEGQDVTFTVDAYPGRNFAGRVKQVRNAAKSVENVITYETIIDVENPGHSLKPGMTANVSVIIARRDDTLRLANAALRVRLPEGMQVPPPEPERPAGRNEGAESKTPEGTAVAAGTEAPSAPRQRSFGGGNGGNVDPERRARFMAMMASNPEMAERFRQRSQQSSRVVYKFVGTDKEPKLEAVRVRTGISDGSYTEIIRGLEDGDRIVTSVIIPGAKAAASSAAQMRAFGSGGRPGGGRGFRGF